MLRFPGLWFRELELPTSPQHKHGSWGSQLQCSSLCNEYFIYWAMSPVLSSWEWENVSTQDTAIYQLGMCVLYVCLLICVRVLILLPPCVEYRGQHWLFSWSSTDLFSGQFLSDFWAHPLSRLGGLRFLEGPHSLLLHARITVHATPPNFLHGCSVSVQKASCLCSKQFTTEPFPWSSTTIS